MKRFLNQINYFLGFCNDTMRKGQFFYKRGPILKRFKREPGAPAPFSPN